MAIIEVENLVKTYKTSIKEKGIKGYVKHLLNPKYKEFKAVNNISFKVEEGELVGYIGENGAGKSTSIKMLTRSFNSYIWQGYSKWINPK